MGSKRHLRSSTINVRLSATELEEWRSKSAAAGVSLSELLRQAMLRTRPWTVAARDIERERTRQITRIGRNLVQIARWANRYKGRAEAVEVITHLAAIEHDLAGLRSQAEGRKQC